jgi:hypothetical protein
MLDNHSSAESEAHALLDQAVLQLMLDSGRQRPWSEAEVARIIGTQDTFQPASNACAWRASSTAE